MAVEPASDAAQRRLFLLPGYANTCIAVAVDSRFAPPAHGRWLSEHVPGARLVMREGEGHLGIMEHLGEMLDALTAPAAAAAG